MTSEAGEPAPEPEPEPLSDRAAPGLERLSDRAAPGSGRLPEPMTPGSEPLSDGTAKRVADTMFALATPSRLQILAALRERPLTVSEIVELVQMEQSAVSHQLRVLRDHAILGVRRIGRRREYALRDEFIRSLLDDALAHVRELEGRPTQASERRSTRSSDWPRSSASRRAGER